MSTSDIDEDTLALMDQLVEIESRKFSERTRIGDMPAMQNAFCSQEVCATTFPQARQQAQQQTMFQAGPSNPGGNPPLQFPGQHGVVGNEVFASGAFNPSHPPSAGEPSARPLIDGFTVMNGRMQENRPTDQQTGMGHAQNPPQMEMPVHNSQPIPVEIANSTKKIRDYELQLAFADEEIREMEEKKRRCKRTKVEKAEVGVRSQNVGGVDFAESQQPGPIVSERSPKRQKKDEAVAGPSTSVRGPAGVAAKSDPLRNWGGWDESFRNDDLAKRAVVDRICENASMQMLNLVILWQQISEGTVVNFDYPVDLELLRNFTLHLADLKLRMPLQSLLQSSVELIKSIVTAGLSAARKQPDAEGKNLSTVHLLAQAIDILSCLLNGVGSGSHVIDITGVVDLLGDLVKMEEGWVVEDNGFSNAVLNLAEALAHDPENVIDREVFELLLSKGFFGRNLGFSNEKTRVRSLAILLEGEYRFSEINEAEKTVLLGVLECIYSESRPPDEVPALGGGGRRWKKGGFETGCRKAYEFVATCIMHMPEDCLLFLVDGFEAEDFVGVVPRICKRLRVSLDCMETLKKRSSSSQHSEAIRQHMKMLLEGMRILQHTLKLETPKVRMIAALSRRDESLFCKVLLRIKSLGLGRWKFSLNEVVPLPIPKWVFAIGSNHFEGFLHEGGMVSTLRYVASKTYDRWKEKRSSKKVVSS
ncbi:hypothetical protein BSKO_00193 [Bryopsis sp. KO-2023]|nr:hypothetical protein BSKO_00193 [Bryopsis sp. KO-2023]